MQVPKAGDKILYTSRAGDYSENARIDRVNDDGTLAVHFTACHPFSHHSSYLLLTFMMLGLV